ncbi:helix-turn-helix domain-containing protein, partial [Faecalibacter rhinopitheci]
MSQNYTRLSQQERFKIEKYLDQKLSISSIAVLLNRNKSTISREVNKFKKRCYDAFISHQIAFEISMNKNYGRSKILR